MSRTKAKNQLFTRYGTKHWFSSFCSYNFFMDCEHFLHKSFFMNIVVKYKEPKSRCMFREKLAKEIILLALIFRSPSSEKCFYVDQSSQGLNRGFKDKATSRNSLVSLLTTSFVYASSFRPWISKGGLLRITCKISEFWALHPIFWCLHAPNISCLSYHDYYFISLSSPSQKLLKIRIICYSHLFPGYLIA